MTNLFLDIESHSPHKEFNFDGMKVITIQHKKESDTSIVVRAEWYKGKSEKAILQDFKEFLKNELEKDKYLTLIGHNLLRFDIPFLIHRMQIHEIDTPENLLSLFHNTVVIDTMQVLLPFNNYFIKGTAASYLDEILNIKKMKHANNEIKDFYENEEERYKIIEHAEADILFTQDLWTILKSDKIISNQGRISLKK